MGFSEFYGNQTVVEQVRLMLARDRFPHAVIFSGPEGAGKYTLAQMISKALNCLEPPKGAMDFCGRCANCARIAESDDLATRFSEAVEAREGLRETDKKETRIFVQTHPDLLVIPPDPPQMMIKVDQIRQVISRIYKRPREAKRATYTFTNSAFMKEAANSLLKILEEPPDFASLLLLTTNSGELLPTIRSRCITISLSPLKIEEIDQFLQKARPELNASTRGLVARLSEGAIGKALQFDLDAYRAARTDGLTLLNMAAKSTDHSTLFRTTETYRAGAEGKQKTDLLIRGLYSLLEDLLFLQSGKRELVRNSDIEAELKRLSESVNFEWIVDASSKLSEVERGMRRNILRSLSLDSFATGLERESA